MSTDSSARKLKMALIGGGGAGFIGRVHAVAGTLDNQAELVAGALSSNAEKSRACAADFGIPPERAYGSFEELIEAESKLSTGERVDFVGIATPNFTHFEIANAALEAGLNVVCDKPLTNTVREAEQLLRKVNRQRAVFAVTHNYSGYPMIRQARQMIQEGSLGEIQAIRVNYIQGWLRGLQPDVTPKRGAWKSDPAKAGPSGAMADIGTHAFHLARYVTQLVPEELSCRLMKLHPTYGMDDYGHALVRFANDAVAAMTISQVTHGRLNDLTIEVDGSDGSLAWRQEDPNQLVLRRFGCATETLERNPNASYMSAAGSEACRLPAGHPEAFFEAFANVYRDFIADVRRQQAGHLVDVRETKYPNVYDGLEGVHFIQQCVNSNRDGGKWLTLRHPDVHGEGD